MTADDFAAVMISRWERNRASDRERNEAADMAARVSFGGGLSSAFPQPEPADNGRDDGTTDAGTSPAADGTAAGNAGTAGT